MSGDSDVEPHERLPVTETAVKLRPWYELRSAITWLDLRAAVAMSRAASTASVPEPTKKALDGVGVGASSTSRSARRTMGSIRYSVEVCVIWSAWARRASTIDSTPWPEIVVTMPPNMSRYSLSSESHTVVPLPRTSSMGRS